MKAPDGSLAQIGRPGLAPILLILGSLTADSTGLPLPLWLNCPDQRNYRRRPGHVKNDRRGAGSLVWEIVVNLSWDLGAFGNFLT